jgi:hypothetical protein
VIPARLTRRVLRGIAVLYACAALLLGFGHRMTVDVVRAPDIAALLAAGGTLPAGCGPAGQEDGKGLAGGFLCDACLVQQGAAPPAPAGALAVPCVFLRVTPAATAAQARPPSRASRPPSRGPPMTA